MKENQPPRGSDEAEDEMSGPWRATRLWNSIIRNFRADMPVKRHKKNLRTYDACFTGSDAVEFLHRNLQQNPNFGRDVTKEQTVQLLRKLFRAGIIESVREESSEEEFKVSGELYRFSTRSPVRNLRTPGKTDRKPLADTANTPRRLILRDVGGDLGEPEQPKPRDTSRTRKAKEEMKKQLNLTYFQALPSNSLIILDNDDTWRRVFMRQLGLSLSPDHVARLDFSGQLDMAHVMHNMTRVSAKGIVQVGERSEDLPHWVLSAMKCLANWPKQLKTVGGRESCLPNYSGFENDVFNVVKDYFLGLHGPLTTYPLYEFLVDAYAKTELAKPPPMRQVPPQPPLCPLPPPGGAGENCGIHPGSFYQPCSRPFTQTDLDTSPPHHYHHQQQQQPVDAVYQNSNQDRVDRIRETFRTLPPLATSSLQTSSGSHNSTYFTSSSSSGHHSSTFDSAASPIPPITSPADGNDTAFMRSYLPPKTCFETAFMQESPVTRIVPQKEHEVLHFTRSPSGRSLTHIASGGWTTKTTSTQTGNTGREEGDMLVTASSATTGNSLKRIPRWKRTSRLRKSIAVMESRGGSVGATVPSLSLNTGSNLTLDNGKGGGGFVNGGFLDISPRSTEEKQQLQEGGGGGGDSGWEKRHRRRTRTLCSTSDLPEDRRVGAAGIRGCSSVDNLLDREHQFEQDFMLKYRQVSGDLRSSCDLVELARKSDQESRARFQQRETGVGVEENKSVIESKAVRKEKRKKRWRYGSTERMLNDDIDLRSAVSVKSTSSSTTGSVGRAHEETDRATRYCYTNPALESSPVDSNKENSLAPLARQEICDLSPVVPVSGFLRNSKYNASYRLATNQPATPHHLHRLSLPRTSTKLQLEPVQALGERTATRHNSQNTNINTGHTLYRDNTSYPHHHPHHHHQQSSHQLRKPGGSYNDDCLYVRAEPYTSQNSDASSVQHHPARCETNGGHHSSHPPAASEAVYTMVGGGGLTRYTVPAPPLLEVLPLSSENSNGLHRRMEAAGGHTSSSFRRHTAARLSRTSQATTVDSGRYSAASRISWHGSSSRRGQPLAMVVPPPLFSDNPIYSSVTAAAVSGQPPPPAFPYRERLVDGGIVPTTPTTTAVDVFKLLALLIPPQNRRKLQLLLKFIRKVAVNQELKLDPSLSNREISLQTFTDVILRPADLSRFHGEISWKIVNLFIDKYDEIWTPPQSLRREVEDSVYRSLVNRRLQAGEDPYPITYCKQVSKTEYERERLTGADTALLELLDTLLTNNKLSDRERRKKLAKFKESYPHLWRRRFSQRGEEEPDLNVTRKEKLTSKFSSLSRIKSAMGM